MQSLTSFRNILVTGCAGFIGSNFIRVLRAHAPHIWISGIDNFSTGRRDALPADIELYEGDINNHALLEKIFSKHEPDTVFHFAALPPVPLSIKSPTETSRSNLLGTISLLEKARDHKTRRFIYSSSAAVYGNTKKALTSEKIIPEPVSPYGLQKYAGELFAKQFAALFDMDIVSLRYFNVFGPGQYGESAYATVIPRWLTGLYGSSSQIFIEGDGTQSRDFCYVDNVCEANIRALVHSTKFAGEVFNIGSGKRIDIATLRSLIEKHTGRKLPLIRRPARVGDIKHSQADIKKAREILKYKPVVEFEEGLIRTIDWFKTQTHQK